MIMETEITPKEVFNAKYNIENIKSVLALEKILYLIRESRFDVTKDEWESAIIKYTIVYNYDLNDFVVTPVVNTCNSPVAFLNRESATQFLYSQENRQLLEDYLKI